MLSRNGGEKSWDVQWFEELKKEDTQGRLREVGGEVG